MINKAMWISFCFMGQGLFAFEPAVGVVEPILEPLIEPIVVMAEHCGCKWPFKLPEENTNWCYFPELKECGCRNEGCVLYSKINPTPCRSCTESAWVPRPLNCVEPNGVGTCEVSDFGSCTRGNTVIDTLNCKDYGGLILDVDIPEDGNCDMDPQRRMCGAVQPRLPPCRAVVTYKDSNGTVKQVEIFGQCTNGP